MFMEISSKFIARVMPQRKSTLSYGAFAIMKDRPLEQGSSLVA